MHEVGARACDTLTDQRLRREGNRVSIHSSCRYDGCAAVPEAKESRSGAKGATKTEVRCEVKCDEGVETREERVTADSCAVSVERSSEVRSASARGEGSK